MQEDQVQALVRELDPAGHNQDPEQPNNFLLNEKKGKQ